MTGRTARGAPDKRERGESEGGRGESEGGRERRDHLTSQRKVIAQVVYSFSEMIFRRLVPLGEEKIIPLGIKKTRKNIFVDDFMTE